MEICMILYYCNEDTKEIQRVDFMQLKHILVANENERTKRNEGPTVRIKYNL